jgi:hypothetical protein
MRTEVNRAVWTCGGKLAAALGFAVVAAVLVTPTGDAAQVTPAATATPAAARPATPSAKPTEHAKKPERVIPVSMTKGETYTINGVAEDGSPGIKVMENPNALVVRTDAPGRIVLVGADSGTWRLSVTLASGEKVIYEITVRAIAPAQGSLEPGAAPTVMQ